MVNSGSFDSDGQGDRNAKVGCTQPHNASDSTQSSSPVTASAATSCKTDFSQTADSDLPSVAHAIEPTPTKTEFNCDMPVENFTNLSSVDGPLEESEKPPVSSSEDEKTSLCCSLPLDKVQGVLIPYHPSATKADDDGTKVKQPTRKLLCLYCERSFVSANLRQKHVERIHSVKQNRRFSSRRQNQLTVTPCVYCDKINGTENTLKDLFQHLINEHSSKYFGCLPCEDRFLTSSLLADHNVSKHGSSPPQNDNILDTSTSSNKTTLRTPKMDDIKVKADEEATEEIPVKLTRSRMRPKLDEDNGKSKTTIIGNKKKCTKLKEMRTKKLSVKSSRIALKRRESKRLQAIAKVADSQKKKGPKPGIEKKQSNLSKTEQTNSTKSTEKVKSNATCINPYPEFDNFYRVKKITDHSIDNLKISSLTFDDVFDKAFFNRIKCNIEENLLHHIDGKLFKNEESESRISNFEKVSNFPQEVQSSSSENYGCELSLNAVTPVASLSLNSQFGEDFESQIEYGSKPSKKKPQIRKDEIRYKYFTRRKYQASILEHKENRDLSKLDMWTQLVIKKRQQKILDEKKTAKEILEYNTSDEYKNKLQREELNRILDRRGPFEDLKEEASKKAALDKLNSASEDNISQESFTEVRAVLNEIVNRVFAATEEVKTEAETATEKAATCTKPDLREIPSYLNLRRTSSLPSEGEIDKSDKIALICSSQETENFELPTNQVRGKNELIELTGEWARSRMYICAACGAKLPNMKYLLEHKSLYHQNVWVQHYEFVGNQSKLYRHLSIPALGKVGAVEESVQCKSWKRSAARVCTKCGKQCNSLGELHRHILECGGDWTWMLARKKCKYRPFGAKSRRKRRGLVHRFPHKQKTEPTEKKTYKKTFDGPRQRPSDADTIQRMLANLPAKRSTRKLISLQDGIYRARKNTQINNINQNKVKCGKVIYKSSSRKETTEKTINTSVNVTGTSTKQKSKQSSNRRSLRSINKVLASRILDTNSKLSVKRKIKVLNEQRRTRRSRLSPEENKEAVDEQTDTIDSVFPSPPKAKTNSTKKDDIEITGDEPVTKRSSPRSSPKNVKKKMSVKKLLTGKINIKSFFPVKKKKNRKSLTESQTPKDNIAAVENADIKTRSKRKSKEIFDTENEKKEVVTAKVENKKTKSETFNKLVRSLSIQKKKVPKSAVHDKTVIPNINNEKTKKQIMTSENPKPTEKDEKVSVEDETKTEQEKTSKKRKLKRSFRNVINRVKKLKIDNASESVTQAEEMPQSQRKHTSAFLEQSKPDESVPPAHLEKIVIPSIVEAKENTADISIPAPIVMNFHETNEGPPIPETVFTLESSNEKSLQAKGELDFDSQPLLTNINSEDNLNNINTRTQSLLTAGSETALGLNEKTQPISIETSVKPKIVPLISPNMKGKIRKPTRGLNDCIAMLTSKLQQKIEEKPVDSVFTILPSETIKEGSPKSEFILRIPSFKSQKTYPEAEETALDLSTKSSSNPDLSETDYSAGGIKGEVAEEIEKIMTTADDNVTILQTVLPNNTIESEKIFNSVDKIIEEVIENKIQIDLQDKWNSVDETIQKVIDQYPVEKSLLPSRSTIDDIIDFVVEYGSDKHINVVDDSKTVAKPDKILEKSVRNIGSVRKPKNKKCNTEVVKVDENVDTTTTEKVIVNTKSHVTDCTEVTLNRINSLNQKTDTEIVPNETTIDTKPIVQKPTNSKCKILDDDVENVLEKIDAFLNEAFIDTTERTVGKSSSIKNKTGDRKVGQARNISKSKKTVSDTKPSEQMLLETNLDTILHVKEINVNSDVSTSANLPVGHKRLTKDEEINQLFNEDEPHMLENKIMSRQSIPNISSSDSEDDIPLAALVKPDADIQTKCEDNKRTKEVEDRKLENSSKIDETSKMVIDSFSDLMDAEAVPKKVTEPKSKLTKKKNENLNVELFTNVTVSVSTSVEVTAVENENGGIEKDITETDDNCSVTKKRPNSSKNTSKAENNSNSMTVNGENITRKIQQRKSRSGRRKTEKVSKSEPFNKNFDAVLKSDGPSDLDLATNLEAKNEDKGRSLVTEEISQAVENRQINLDVSGLGEDLSENVMDMIIENQKSSKNTLEKMTEGIPNKSVVVNTNSSLTLTAPKTESNVLDSSGSFEVKKSVKRRGRPPKKKSLSSETNSSCSFPISKDIREIPKDFPRNTLYSVESVTEMKQPGEKKARSAKNKTLSSENIETNFDSSPLLNGNIYNEAVDTSFTELTGEQAEATENTLGNISNSTESVKKPVKRRSRSSKKTNLTSETDETSLESNITPPLSEDNGIGSTNEEADASLIESLPDFVEPEVKSIKPTRSRYVRRKNSIVESSFDSLLSDSSMNSSELSEGFGEKSSVIPPVLITDLITQRFPKRKTRPQKTQRHLEEDEKLSNISTDSFLLEVDASILGEHPLPLQIVDKKGENITPPAKVKIAKTKRPKLCKKKSMTKVNGGMNIVGVDQNLESTGDVAKSPPKTFVNEFNINSLDITEDLESNGSSIISGAEITDKSNEQEAVTEFLKPIVQTKKKKSRSVRKKCIIECTDSEEENSDNVINNTRPSKIESDIEKTEDTLSSDNTSDVKKPLNLGKEEQISTSTAIDGSTVKIDDLLKDFVKPETKNDRNIKDRSRLTQNVFLPEDIFGDTVTESFSFSNPEDTNTSKIENINVTHTLDEIIKDLSFENNTKLKLEQRRGSLKNSHKTKNKGNKISLPQVDNEKHSNQTESVELSQSIKSYEGISSDVHLSEISKENVPLIDKTPKENNEPPIQSEIEKPIDPNCQEPSIKLIINKQKTRRKSKSFKKVDLKGQNDLFEDFALVIKKPKRIAPIITYTPSDTFLKDPYPNYIKKHMEQSSPVPMPIPEEITRDLDDSVEEMDMELDEIPITSNIIENLSFTTNPPVPNLFVKEDIESLVETLIVPDNGNSLILPEKKKEPQQTTKKRGRPAKNKALKDIQNKDLPLTTEVEEEIFLYETNRRTTRSKSMGDIKAVVYNTGPPGRTTKSKGKNRNSLGASIELAKNITEFDIIPEKLMVIASEEHTEVNVPVSPTVDKTVESISNILDFISGIDNKDDRGTDIVEESPKKVKKLKYNNRKEVQADLEGDSKSNFDELDEFVPKEIETIQPSFNLIETKTKKFKSDTPEIEPVKSHNSTNQNMSFDKDIDSIYAFTELDDLEIDLPIEKPKRTSRKPSKSFTESTNKILNDNICVTDVENSVDEETVSKLGLKRKSRSGRDLFSTNQNKEENLNTGEIKENTAMVDITENGRRKSIRSAKVKALEHIHDDALAELTESERNRDLDKDKTILPEDNLTTSDALSKRKSSRRQSKAPNPPKLSDNPKLSKQSIEESLLTDLTDGLEELEKGLDQADIMSSTDNSSEESTTKKHNKNPSKTQKVQQLHDDLELLQESVKESQLLADLTGLDELEDRVENELKTKTAKQPKNKPFKRTQDSENILSEPNVRVDSLAEGNNQELRRSRRGSKKIASYNENDLVDPLLDEIDGKRKHRKKEISDGSELDTLIETDLVKKTKEPEKKLNSDELFDLLKASSKEDIYIPKASNSFLSNLEDSSRDLNEDNFDNMFENILEKSTFLIQNNVIDESKEEKDMDKIYEFAESPESNDQTKDDVLVLECKRKIHKKLPKTNMLSSKLQEDNSVLDTFSIPSTPDLHDSSVDSKPKTVKSDKLDTSGKSNYCDICNKSFIRVENLIKHKRTLTHIQKLSEIEAKEAANKSKEEQTQNECSKASDSILEITSESSKVTSDLYKTEINISDILQESNKPSEPHSPIMHSSFSNNHSLKLADIINDVLNKPVLEGDNEKRNSFSDIIMQNNADHQPEYRRYKSLGERKSFDSEPAEPTQPITISDSYVSKTTILEKQISLLENIIENQTGVNYIDDISMSSNSMENVLENNSARASPSEISLKQDDSSNIIYAANNVVKPNTEDSFLKPSQYEEISEDSVNLRNYEDQKLRKTLNRDEELFLECCSLLKSGSEVSSYSNRKSQNKILSTMGLRQCDEPEWLERKSLVQKPLYEVDRDYSDDNSRIPTPLGDSYDDDASNSNTITSNWNMNKKVPVFEDISQDQQDPGNKSFTFEEVLNDYDEHETKNKNSVSKLGEILSKTITNQIDAVHKIIRKPVVTAKCEEKKKQEELSDGSTSDSKKIITKGARKVFEGLKVSIPTEELNLEEVLNCSPKSKKLEFINIQNFVENVKLAEEQPSSQSKPSRTARKSKPVKNKSQFGSNLLFKMNKKKVLSPTSTKMKEDDIKTHDIYDFEETQDNTDVFTKPDFRTFRNMKSGETVLEPESDTESRDYLDSFSYEAQSVTSSVSSSSSKKPKTQENITKKKHMIMGRIFKNAAKSKIEDIDEEIRDIPAFDNSELVQSYVASCKKIIKNEEVVKPKLSENEINQLFDQLLENKLVNQESVHSDTRTTVKSKSEIRKTENKKKTKTKNKKRTRTNSESTDDEFGLNKTTKKRTYRKNAKAEDNCINLEQELRECIGVASRKSQRKCTSGKQNVLVEYWSSDDSQFEALLESQRLESKQSTQTLEEKNPTMQTDLLPHAGIDFTIENDLEGPFKAAVSEPTEKSHRPKNTDKKPQLKRKRSEERKPKTNSTTVNGKTVDTVTSNRRKRAAANPLYHWSSSSEDEFQDLIEVKPIRDEVEDDEDRPVQHGWIVGDSPKKLVTMLAQAKGKKTDIDCVKEQGKKRTNAVS